MTAHQGVGFPSRWLPTFKETKMTRWIRPIIKAISPVLLSQLICLDHFESGLLSNPLVSALRYQAYESTCVLLHLDDPVNDI